MKILIFLMCICYILPVQPRDMDRYAYCESCLKTAQEIEKALKEAPPAEDRLIVVENLLSGTVCNKLLSYKHDHVSTDKMMSSCMDLIESNYDQFYEALLNKEPKQLGVVLCYEQSMACVGVKRQSFERTKTTYSERDIEALLHANKEHVRVAQPVHSRDEL